MKLYILLALTTATFWILSAPSSATADAGANDHTISFADGKLSLTAPSNWLRKKPATSIVEHEFAVPAAKGDETEGRMTIMGAGGSVDDNINRWYGQFTQPDGGSTKDRAKVEKITAAGEAVHLVDISGTFRDQRGPFAPAVERSNYRMLAAIITTKDAGNYFVKFYGPQKTIAENAQPFRRMIEGLQKK